MNPGELDRRVTLRKLAEGQSDSGAVVYSPLSIATVWASKASQPGTESFTEGQTVGFAPVIWRTRWFRSSDLEDPTVKWQLVEGAQVYDVLSVIEIGRREGWEFLTRARAERAA